MGCVSRVMYTFLLCGALLRLIDHQLGFQIGEKVERIASQRHSALDINNNNNDDVHDTLQSQPIKIGKFYWNCIKILMDFYPILSEDLLLVPQLNVHVHGIVVMQNGLSLENRISSSYAVICWRTSLMLFDIWCDSMCLFFVHHLHCVSSYEWKDFNFLHFLFILCPTTTINTHKKKFSINAAEYELLCAVSIGTWK